MSLDSETSASATSGRDWFFPSPSFFRSSSSQYGRRFYLNPKPYSPPSSNRPSPSGIRHRRRVKFTRNPTPTSTPTPTPTHETPDSKNASKNNLAFLSQFRCQFALVVGSSFPSLSHSLTVLFVLTLTLAWCGCRR